MLRCEFRFLSCCVLQGGCSSCATQPLSRNQLHDTACPNARRLRPRPGCGAGAAEACGSQRRRLRPGPGGGPEEVSCRRPSRERRAEKKNALLLLLSEVAVKKCGRRRMTRCRGAPFRSSFFPSNLSLRSGSPRPPPRAAEARTRAWPRSRSYSRPSRNLPRKSTTGVSDFKLRRCAAGLKCKMSLE